MDHLKNVKEIVKEKYGEIAKSSSSCCGPVSYTHLDVYKRQDLDAVSAEIMQLLQEVHS